MSFRYLPVLLFLATLAAACGAESSSGPSTGEPVVATTTTTSTVTTTMPTSTSTVVDLEDDYGFVEDDDPYTNEGTSDTTLASSDEPVRTPVPVESTIPGAVTGEVPDDVMAAIFDHAAETTGRPAGRFTVAQAEAVVWSDGSLGCPQPGVVYTQALVDGYLVVLEGEEVRLEYHASQDGGFVLCSPLRDRTVAP